LADERGKSLTDVLAELVERGLARETHPAMEKLKKVEGILSVLERLGKNKLPTATSRRAVP